MESIYSLRMGEATWGSVAMRRKSNRAEPGRSGGKQNLSTRSLAKEEQPPEDAEQDSLRVSRKTRTILIMGVREKQAW